MGVERRFACVAGCGACCRNLRVPLTAAEAIAWSGRGHAVDILTEAMIVANDESVDNDTARHKLPRSHAGACGALPIAIHVVLAASFPDGSCPNLDAATRCRIHAERPSVCRIYPMEATPLIAFDPALKSCPPGAWSPTAPLLVGADDRLPAELQTVIDAYRRTAIDDVPIKARLCHRLGVRAAGLSGDGFVVHALSPEILNAALSAATTETEEAPGERWALVSNRASTVAALNAARARGVRARGGRIEGDSEPRRSHIGHLPDED